MIPISINIGEIYSITQGDTYEHKFLNVEEGTFRTR